MQLTEYRTELFKKMQTAQRGNCKNSYMNLLVNRPGLINSKCQEQVDFITDIVSLPDFVLTSSDGEISLKGPNMDIHVSNPLTACNTRECTVTYNGETKNTYCEYCDRFLAVYWVGEIIAILPIYEKETDEKKRGKH